MASSRARVLLLRHGHRAPIANIFATPSPSSSAAAAAGALEAEERALWAEHRFVPPHARAGDDDDDDDDDTGVHTQQSAGGGANNQGNSTRELREEGSPFGHLTREGWAAAWERGRVVGVETAARGGGVEEAEGRPGMGSLKCRSTPFARTVNTVQAFAQGMRVGGGWGGHAAGTRRQQQQQQEEEEEEQAERTGGVQILVQESMCPMCPYQWPNAMIKDTMRAVRETSHFQKEEAECSEAMQAMAEVLPGVTKRKGPGLTSTADGGFDWIAAADYFTCRRAHSMGVDPSLEWCEDIITGHLARRWWHYFQFAPHLAAVALPFLNLLHHECMDVVARSQGDAERGAAGDNWSDEDAYNSTLGLNFDTGPGSATTTLLGCHDITLLMTLYALRSPLVIARDSCYWPEFAELLQLEMVDPARPDTMHEDATFRLVLGAGASSQVLPVLDGRSDVFSLGELWDLTQELEHTLLSEQRTIWAHREQQRDA